MDSIERMRRINDLTRELKQRGFAESSFEAIQQANQIYGSDDLDDNVKHGIIKNSAHDKLSVDLDKDSKKDVVKDETMGDDSVPYNDRKLAKITENVDLLTNKMNEIIKAINDLDSRLSEIKIKQDKLITLSRQEPRMEPRVEVKVEANLEQKHEPKSEAVLESKSESKPEVRESRKDEYSMNQRTGNFQSQDVAIDKMFYFGKK